MGLCQWWSIRCLRKENSVSQSIINSTESSHNKVGSKMNYALCGATKYLRNRWSDVSEVNILHRGPLGCKVSEEDCLCCLSHTTVLFLYKSTFVLAFGWLEYIADALSWYNAWVSFGLKFFRRLATCFAGLWKKEFFWSDAVRCLCCHCWWCT